jgi:hypothetical protein
MERPDFRFLVGLLMNLTDHIILDPKDPYEMNYMDGVPPIETLTDGC